MSIWDEIKGVAAGLILLLYPLLAVVVIFAVTLGLPSVMGTRFDDLGPLGMIATLVLAWASSLLVLFAPWLWSMWRDDREGPPADFDLDEYYRELREHYK